MRLFALLALTIAAVSMTFAQSGKEIITAGGNPNSPFSPAVKADGLIYVSGMGGNPPNGQIAKGDVKAQTRQTLENINAALKAGGSSLANATSMMVYLRNASDFAAMNEVYAKYLATPGAVPPARSTVAVAGLPKDALVEIEVVAKEA